MLNYNDRVGINWHVDIKKTSDVFMKALIIYHLIATGTFLFLTFFDGYPYNSWNWLIAVPVNIFVSEIWPIYWLILKPIMG